MDKWRDHIGWADVIIFDDTGFGEEAEKLRKKGKLVIGGTVYTDRTEEDREFGQGEMIVALIAHSDFGGKLLSCGVEEIPVSGQNTEVLKYHKLDTETIAGRTYENYIHI